MMTPTAVLNRQIASLRNNRIVRVLLNATDMMVLLLNEARQILYASEAFCRLVGVQDDAELLGMKIGNAWHCVHSDETPEGCGGSEACQHCNVYNTLIRAIHENGVQTQDASVVHLEDGLERSLNVMTHVVPAELFEVNCFIVTLVDISDTLHRRWFEKLFYHDLLNKLGALGNYLELMSREMPEDFQEDITFVKESFRSVVEDIRYQKQVSEAESGDLQVERMTLVPNELMRQVARLFKRYAEARQIKIVTQSEPVGYMVFSDYLLLRRVLENMVKNALEASRPEEHILIGIDGPNEEQKGLTFWVWNPGYMSPEVQRHIFQRNFSTKGNGRGMGTYSMKLIGERGLQGEVGFSSSAEAGTRFHIRLPATKPENEPIVPDATAG